MIRDWRQRRRDIKAAREMKRLIDTGEMDLHVVGTTPSGKEVTVPTPLLAEWNAMSEKDRADVLRLMDEAREQ